MRRFYSHPWLVVPVVLLLLVAYGSATLGVIPSPRAVARWFGVSTTERYPCESCGCGCASALECWTACCCHTEHQRLIWAIENGVLPPEGVEFSDNKWIAASNAVAPGSAHCELCVPGIKERLRRGIVTASAGRACNQCVKGSGDQCDKGCRLSSASGTGEGAGACCQQAGDTPEPRPLGPSLSALACKKLQLLLAMTVPPAPPCRVADLIPPSSDAVVVEVPADWFHTSRALETPEPPPREDGQAC